MKVVWTERAFESRVSEAIAGEYRLGQVNLVYPGASVGVRSVLPGSLDAEQALKEADAAMYKVKQKRRKRSEKRDLLT